nr:ABC transporter ATP-binding protein [uncultured Methanoregula sp.]
MTNNTTAIRINNLGKQYQLGGPQGQYHTFRDAIVNTLKIPFKKIHRTSPNEGFWALKDVSFEIGKGEVIGIIGKNGAGKSTLLKILSRITPPTNGYIELHGRVGSLLEVGTGFHPELTGRENIYLSGSILGMKKSEIDSKFDEIVKFSEIEQFIDTPVKRYSSGMYVRLAFAVAAHLEPEILLVDEVLAVGDASFQKKCLGKMGDVGREGRTILFVSHNMTAIKALCNRTIVINSGQVQFDGNTDEAVAYYLNATSASNERLIPISDRPREHYCSLRAKIIEISVISDEKKNPEIIDPFKPLIIQMKVSANSDVRCSATLYIADEIQNFCMFDSSFMHKKDIFLKPGINTIECNLSQPLLYAGDYIIKCGLNIHGAEIIDRVENGYTFSVAECDPTGSGYNVKKGGDGIFYIEHEWIQK